MQREQHIGEPGRLGKTECSGLGSQRSNRMKQGYLCD